MKGNKDNIILIGMPGVGKSTIGVVLAKVMGYQFVDSDLVIQEQTGRLLKDIIAEEGIDKFVQIENDVNKSLNIHRAIIATGGSVVYGKEAMEHLSQIGTVVYLELELAALSKRLGSLEKRGVVLKEGQTLKSLYNERIPLYQKYADIIVSEHHSTIPKTVQKIIEKLEETEN
ncbi:shikimate kinase [uncultured Eubacterium sp.]|uniref:shikimate kinase n=1 Tax=uncultured Eubacterium sp. TaxID=165185 RepID=UPI0026725A96|nr:shikimate kinase [uncultured Eubacterium sp.]